MACVERRACARGCEWSSALALRAVLEAPGFIPGLDDFAMMREAVEQPRRHLGVALPGTRARVPAPVRVSQETVRERTERDPGTCCFACGGELRLVGEDVSEILDMIAAQMKVIEIARLKKSCRCYEKMVQLPALAARYRAAWWVLAFWLTSRSRSSTTTCHCTA